MSARQGQCTEEVPGSDDDYDDDSTYLPESYVSMVCENKVRYGLDTAPAVAHYGTDKCKGLL